MTPSHRDVPGVITPPPLIFLAGLLLGWLVHLLLPASLVPAPWNMIIATAAIAAGVALAFPALREMRRAGTSPNVERPTTALVTGGPFAMSRNPIYVSFALLHAGIALLVNSLAMLLMLGPVLVIVHIGVIAREERYLERRFGDEYRRYRARVRPWI